jgi:hypothetical protein
MFHIPHPVVELSNQPSGALVYLHFTADLRTNTFSSGTRLFYFPVSDRKIYIRDSRWGHKNPLITALLAHNPPSRNSRHLSLYQINMHNPWSRLAKVLSSGRHVGESQATHIYSDR